MHNCIHEEELQRMRTELAVCQSDIRQVKDDIKEVKDDIKDMKRFSRSQLVTALFSLIGICVTIVLALKG